MKTTMLQFTGLALLAAAALTVGAAEPAPPAKARAVVTSTNLNEMTLGPADKLHFKLVEDPVKVSDQCIVHVTALGQAMFPVSRGFDETILIQTKGRTVDDVMKELKAKLEDKYYKTATVQLTLVSQTVQPGRALFVGPAIKGFVTMTPGVPTYLTDAISERGFTEFANLSRVEIDRVTDDPDKPNKIVVNVEAIMKNKKGERKNDIVLEDGDRITVKDKWWNL